MDGWGRPIRVGTLSLPGRLGGLVSALGRVRKSLEALLEAERTQLPLWVVVAFGCGIAAWFALPDARAWVGVMTMGFGLTAAGSAAGGRIGNLSMGIGLALALGCGWIWLRSETVAHERIERVTIETFDAEVTKVEPLVARGKWRLTLTPDQGASLPDKLRVSLREAQYDPKMGEGARLRVRARLVPPPARALPGGYDFARDAWFRRIGGVGTALGNVEILEPAGAGGLSKVRASLGAHVRERLPGTGDGIVTALATGDKNAVSDEDAEAMRRSGLAHLLAVSGLHIAAVVGGTMVLALKLLALSPKLALRTNLVIVSAAVGALAGVGYTLLTGMQVPTVRACIAALLVLLGLALGRDALSLRLVAVGAAIIMLVRPEALAGASFQLSFAAVTAIIALHAHPAIRKLIGPREESWLRRLGRGFLALLLTGLAVELALIPFALFHFHKAGLYGVAANLIAIPLTTFVIMPAMGLAILFDFVGLGAPFWWIVGITVDGLLALAHGVANAKGAVAMVPTMPGWAFAACVFGMLWLCLWRHPMRYAGLIGIVLGLGAAAIAPRPDILVTGDGRYLAIIDEDGTPFLLRARAGDFIRDVLSESAGFDGEAGPLDTSRFARCNRDACLAIIERDGRQWRLLATRSRDLIAWVPLVEACAQADIVVSERWLPDGCQPRWLKLDRRKLEETGGVSIRLGERPDVVTVAEEVAQYPWDFAPR
ncbi:ComEC/Rec2 family competence protein [Sphingomicrobium sediminis]|uniref:ComEC family competence protein n=1 Tax=Sphingomicrobium sediminis TaxID=2950949 RepID=A0A9X2EFG1_9SPHN|nr:ComEC/Rec2 family competence protein [Sphingomicrobium sediminis]MCM8557008.1 ComEC family competence protein [Sphingomicrobium sediminis]